MPPVSAFLWPLLCGVRAALAAVPTDLTNFHNEYACDVATTRIVRPRTVDDVRRAVQRAAIVRPNGMGHSWNRPFFCSNASTSDNSTSGARGTSLTPSDGGVVNIQLSTLRPLNIEVLEAEGAVWVDAGVLTINLLDYLASYVTRAAPAGWTLGAFPWYVYQTIGGAVATGTHGSSLLHNSLSHQLLAVEMVVANGSVVQLTPGGTPLLMRAARVSVGRLGIITRIKLRIVKEQAVRREVRTLSVSQFLGVMKMAQQQWAANTTLPAELAETEWFWQTQRAEIYMVTFTRGDAPDEATRRGMLAGFEPQSTTVHDTALLARQDAPSRLEDVPLKEGVDFTRPSGLARDAQTATDNILASAINRPVLTEDGSGTRSQELVKRLHPDSRVSGYRGQSEDADRSQALPWTMPKPKAINVMYGLSSSAAPLMDLNKAGVMAIAHNATVESSEAYLYQPAALEFQIKGVLYDQYEVSFPVATMADCLEGLMHVVYGDDIDSALQATRDTDHGFRSAPLIRLVGQEDGLLAQTIDGPRLFINLEDYLYYNVPTRRTNQAFKRVLAYLRSSPQCGSSGLVGGGGRLHWGKAGWPDAGCWHGDREYPGTWCDFGCAVQQLDPANKFEGAAPDRWNWRGVDLQRCCGPEGFNTSAPGCQCSVQHDRGIDSCPPSPYYSYR